MIVLVQIFLQVFKYFCKCWDIFHAWQRKCSGWCPAGDSLGRLLFQWFYCKCLDPEVHFIAAPWSCSSHSHINTADGLDQHWYDAFNSFRKQYFVFNPFDLLIICYAPTTDYVIRDRDYWHWIGTPTLVSCLQLQNINLSFLHLISSFLHHQHRQWIYLLQLI